MPALKEYRTKRDFRRTPEPRGGRAPARRPARRGSRAAAVLAFVVQKHAATRLHYDFRLELDGVLKSWAVPKGPSLVPGDKRLAVEVEDHPLEYGGFEGTIPKGEYGGGSVLLWDRGSWTPKGDAREGLRKGRLAFELDGEKLRGAWILVRMKREEGEKAPWLLMKERDRFSRNGTSKSIVEARPESVATGRKIEEIGRAGAAEREWSSNRPATRRSGRSRATAGARTLRRVPEPATAPVRTAESGRAPSRRRVEPQLATLVRSAPEGDAWLHEIKYDGYRAIALVERKRARLLTRSGQDWTERFQEVADDAASLPVKSAILDGEVVVVEKDGRTNFQALQNSMRRNRSGDLVYFVFDMLEHDGRDLRRLPLEERKEWLRELVARSASRAGRVRYSDHVTGQGPRFHREACRQGLEGIVSKRRDAPYRPGRSEAWLKVKCSDRQEFVIGGFTEPQGSRVGLGALLLGVHERDGLRYSGRVGTGFTHDLARELRKRLEGMSVDRSPFRDPPRGKGMHWVRPELAAEVSFTGFTDDGKVRHPSFQGLREDKPARDTVRERPKVPPKPTRKGPPKRDPGRKVPVKEPPAEDPPKPPVREPPDEVREASQLGVRVTHPGRVIDPGSETTKGDLAAYMATVAERMFPHVEGRPLMLRRCPDGIHRTCFFQKHPSTPLPPSLATVSVTESKGKRPYVSVRTPAGLVSLVQMGAVEVHVWGSRADRDDRPDRMVFDLDPDPSVSWKETVRTAHAIRKRLEELGLTSFAKTTGGKGIHVVVPIRRGPDWKALADLSGAIASEFVRGDPGRYTTHLAKDKRRGRILIDTLRNRMGATWVAPYSSRAREGMTVSTPIAWEELTPRLASERLTVATVPKRLHRADPWAGMERVTQSISASVLREIARKTAGRRV